MINYKTTLSGSILCIMSIVLFVIHQPVEGTMAAVAGIGLLSAKDGDVTGGTRQQ